MIASTNIPIIVVGYRNPQDIAECFHALRSSAADPRFDVYVCENGGASAFDALISLLTSIDGPCDNSSTAPTMPNETPHFVRVRSLQFRGRDVRVLVAEATENLGYAGAINAWLRILQALPAWPSVWILNPDTQPHPRALAELVAWSSARKKGMVGSRIVASAQPELIRTRGLRWRPLHTSPEAIGLGLPSELEPDPDELEDRLDAPSGASMYVTRSCLEHIGLMDERYFLYFEDLDWGYRAKQICGIGYAHQSIVPHHGGTTMGSSERRSASSPLSVYLGFRNCLHFVRKYHRAWLPWTIFVLFLRPLEFGLVGAFANMRAAYSGGLAGLSGETGRPENVVNSHTARHKG